jgi:hypothetical protein
MGRNSSPLAVAVLVGLMLADAHADGLGLPGSALALHQDASSFIMLGGRAQKLLDINARRRACLVQNTSNGDLWLNITGAATAASQPPSVHLGPGDAYECPPPGSIPSGAFYIYGGTTGQTFTALEW